MLEGKTVDAAEPPEIVFESPTQCRERDHGEELLRRALSAARAPGPGWSVAMRVEPAGGGLRAAGAITDGDGVAVAHRNIDGTTADCGGLARAVGVWATLVLDTELRKSRGTPAAAAPAEARAGVASTMGHDAGVPAGSGGSGGAGGGGGSGGSGAPATGDPATASAATSEIGMGAVGGEPVAAWPAPALEEKASPEHDWYLHHDEVRALELGAGLFLMTGAGGGAIAGPTAFVVVEAGHGLFLRPSVAFGESLTSLPPSDVKASTWAAGRFDTCLRMPGLYTRHHGMQLDVCGGTDIGTTSIQSGSVSTLPYWDVGPSVNLRGELGGRLSAVLRAAAGVNILRGSFKDLNGDSEQVPIGNVRLELAFSWDVR
ncbi:MAG: hypothetical protein ABSE49_13175 [Polyangiaceae bacterium]